MSATMASDKRRTFGSAVRLQQDFRRSATEGLPADRRVHQPAAAKGAGQEAVEEQVGRTVEEGREQPDPRRVGRGAATRYLGGPVRQAAKELPVSRGDHGKAHEVEVDHVEKWKTSKDCPRRSVGAARLAQEENDPVALSRSRRITSRDRRRLRGRLNCIAHILKTIPYKKIHREKVKLPKRSTKGSL